ncbi:MAG: hypothetical protein IPI49_08615 [Myxococcales bacterium]|nr:hypothetical protein [Myxococcales bacterium]
MDQYDWRVWTRVLQIVKRPLWVSVACISLLGLGSELLHHAAPSSVTDGALPKLSLSFEGNLPTWFASSLLLLRAGGRCDCARSCTVTPRVVVGVGGDVYLGFAG